VMSTLKGLLNKYAEGKNRYQNLHRMMDARTYPITRTRGDHTVTEMIAKDLAEELAKTHTKTTGTNAKDLAYAKITGTIAKDLAEDGENKDHTGTDAKVQTKTHTGNLNKDLAEEGKNRDHEGTETNTKDLAKVLAKTHTKTTGTIAKDLADTKTTGTIAKDLAEDGENKEGRSPRTSPKMARTRTTLGPRRSPGTSPRCLPRPTPGSSPRTSPGSTSSRTRL
jgi:hypothetical protein